MIKYFCTITAFYLSFTFCLAQIPTNGLVGYWPFNGNANDVSGIGNNGSVIGAILTTDHLGNPNKAYSFDGINDYIIVPDNSSLNFANNHTICAWFKTTNPIIAGEISGTIVGKAKTVNLRSYIIYISGATGTGDSNCYYLFKTNDALYKSNVYTLPYYDDKWHMIATTYDYSTGNMKVYIDNILKKTTTIGQITLEQTSTPLTFGCIHGLTSGYRYYFKGVLDDICIYNRTLTDTEISQVYYQNFVSVNEPAIKKDEITISPNPTNKSESVKISNLSSEELTIKIYDITGKLLLNKHIQNASNNFNLDIQNLLTGIYFVKIIQKNSIKTAKLLVN